MYTLPPNMPWQQSIKGPDLNYWLRILLVWTVVYQWVLFIPSRFEIVTWCLPLCIRRNLTSKRLWKLSLSLRRWSCEEVTVWELTCTGSGVTYKFTKLNHVWLGTRIANSLLIVIHSSQLRHRVAGHWTLILIWLTDNSRASFRFCRLA